MSEKDRTLQTLDWIRARTHDLLKDFPEDKLHHQPSKTDNHVVWTLGHLAMTDEWLHSMIDPKFKSALPESYGKLFGYQTKCDGDAKKYPPYAEVKKHFDATHSALIKAAKTAGDQTLSASLKEKSGGFAEDGFDALLKGVWHEGWHAGQIAGIRKTLGLKPVF